VYIKLYGEHFTIESNNESKDPIVLKYNTLTKQFLKDLTTSRLIPELWEEIQDFSCTYYDGGIICEVMDMKNERNNRRLLLKPDPETFLKDLNAFIESNHHDLSEEDKLTITQRVLLYTKPVYCSPDTEVFTVKNLIQYNTKKIQFRRRRKIAKQTFHKKRSFEHPILSYIMGQNWNTSGNKMFLSGEKLEVSSELKIPDATLMTPLAFLNKTEQYFVNNRPQQRQRVLKFQSTQDKAKVWKVEILPCPNSSGVIKRYDSMITAPNETPTRWSIGSKYSTDLYVKRLKDMFTTYGKAKCIVEQDFDVQALAQYRSNQQNTMMQQPQNNVPISQQPSQYPPVHVVPPSQNQPNPQPQMMVQQPRMVNPVQNQPQPTTQPITTSQRPPMQQQRPPSLPVKNTVPTPGPSSPRQNTGQFVGPQPITTVNTNGPPQVNFQRNQPQTKVTNTGNAPQRRSSTVPQQQPQQQQQLQGPPPPPNMYQPTMINPGQMGRYVPQYPGMIGQQQILHQQQQVIQQMNSQRIGVPNVPQGNIHIPLNSVQYGYQASPNVNPAPNTNGNQNKQ
jgi:hypothetical protein